MSYAEMILPEFDHEMANTRKVLERVPDDKLDWKAHPKLNSIGWNASHLADIPIWVEFTINQDALDVDPVGGKPYKTQVLKSRQEILDVFDKNVAAARKALQSASDAKMQENWSLLAKGQTLMTMPRTAVIRGFVMNHLIHHRAHLLVYLHLNDVPVPGMYGPSADDPGM